LTYIFKDGFIANMTLSIVIQIPQYHENKTFVVRKKNLYHFFIVRLFLYILSILIIFLYLDIIDDMILLIVYDFIDNNKHFLCCMMSGVCMSLYNI